MAGEHARRAAYERLYAEYREAARALDAARARGVNMAELVRLRERMRALWEGLATWRRAE
ncbi:MAG: hypothetical protein AVDCRST_MAG77-4214 [uncultured Chloroflexi bacterium]|uniref:Uncharacterized protein n=1 Tax=uncultured Chloroflexota bacterium TaxID=166587 RepID=A0A6J4JRV9_9CHLR|nr:MAG: hypothetical protein AVDCRST_MAG77-4214 [uncultured Chloroflexota bacterium]